MVFYLLEPYSLRTDALLYINHERGSVTIRWNETIPCKLTGMKMMVKTNHIVLLISLFLATMVVSAAQWELIHEADIVVEETKQVIGANRIELDTSSIKRQGDRVSYRTREKARSYGVEREFIMDRESDCAGNKFRKLRVQDPKTKKTAPARNTDWQVVDLPFENKLQNRVCAQ